MTNKLPSFQFESIDVEYLNEDTVLDALLRNKIPVGFSCLQGDCLSCIVRCKEGDPPATAQEGLTRKMASLGAFKACSCPAAAVSSVSRMRS